MPGKRPPKKSDPLMVRMPHDAKRAFLEACRAEGRTASGVVRELIEGWLRRAEARARLRDPFTSRRSLVMLMKSPAAAGGAIAAGLGALAFVVFGAAPSAAAFDYRASFQALDANGDGVVTLDEYAGGGSHSTIAVEFDPPGGVAPSEPVPGELENAEALEFELDGSPPPTQPTMRWAYMIDMGFREADSDGDGAVDFDEFVKRHEQLLAEAFARWDADGDGRLAVEEALHDAEAPPSARGPFPREVFEAFDRDRDGAITLEEFDGGPA